MTDEEPEVELPVFRHGRATLRDGAMLDERTGVDVVRIRSGDVVVLTSPPDAGGDEMTHTAQHLANLFHKQGIQALVVCRHENDSQLDVLPDDVMRLLGWRRLTPPEREAERVEALERLRDLERETRPTGP